MTQKLTDRNWWKEYWSKHREVREPVRETNAPYFKILNYVMKKFPNIRTAIDLGGFPGRFSIFLRKKFNVQTTLLDIYIDEEIFGNFLKINGVSSDYIQAVEADIFEYEPRELYDFVFSFGLIEHFDPIDEIVKKHVDFAKQGGIVLITVPNFKYGLIGWFNKHFDKEAYDAHNIEILDPDFLRKTLEKFPVEIIETGYMGKFSIWLENYREHSLPFKVFFKTVWFFGKVIFKFLPWNSKYFAPHIYVIARKK